MVLWAIRRHAAPPAAHERAICARLIFPTLGTAYCRGHTMRLIRLPSCTVPFGTLQLRLRPSRIRSSVLPYLGCRTHRRPGRSSRCRRCRLGGLRCGRVVLLLVVPPSGLLPLQLLHLILQVFDLLVSGSASAAVRPAGFFFGGTSSNFFGIAFRVLVLLLLFFRRRTAFVVVVVVVVVGLVAVVRLFLHCGLFWWSRRWRRFILIFHFVWFFGSRLAVQKNNVVCRRRTLVVVGVVVVVAGRCSTFCDPFGRRRGRCSLRRPALSFCIRWLPASDVIHGLQPSQEFCSH